MPFFARHRWGILTTVMLSLIVAVARPVHAQESINQPLENVATVLHPPPGEIVAPLDTLILIEIDQRFIGDSYYYMIVVDNREVTARWDPDARTFSYYPDRMLSTGEHSIKVYMSIVDGFQLQLVADTIFYVGVGGASVQPQSPGELFNLGYSPESPPPAAPVVNAYSTDIFQLYGRASIGIAVADFDGFGSRLRQEPDNTSVFDLNGRGRSGESNFDFRFYLTTDENSFAQPRNRYLFNVEGDNAGFSIGDNTPRFNQFTVDGLRIRGVHAWGTYGAVTLHLLEGQSRRETRSQHDIFNPAQILRRGTEEQRFWAGRAVLWEDEPFSLGFTYLIGNEDAPDENGVGNPGKNTVRSIDFVWNFDGGSGSMRGGYAEADYNFDDPVKDDVSNAQAQYLETSYQVGGHNFKVSYMLIEPGFTSLGSLSLQADRKRWGVEDRMNLWRGLLTGRLYLEKFHNNVSNNLAYTTTTGRYGGELRYRFSLRGPTLIVGALQQSRSNNAPPGESGLIDDSMTMWNIGLVHGFDISDGRIELRADYRSTDRDSNTGASGDSRQDAISISLTSRWTNGFQLDMLYGNTDSNYRGLEQYTNINRYSIRAAYVHPSQQYSLWGRWEGVYSNGTQPVYNSDRDTLEFGTRWMLNDDLSLEASARYVNYNDLSDNASDYTEHSFRIMLIQLLN